MSEYPDAVVQYILEHGIIEDHTPKCPHGIKYGRSIFERPVGWSGGAVKCTCCHTWDESTSPLSNTKCKDCSVVDNMMEQISQTGKAVHDDGTIRVEVDYKTA